MQKGFIYILLSYDFKRKCLKVTIDEKGMVERLTNVAKPKPVVTKKSQDESIELSF
jgi:hypothetical protein